ncbi:ABC transporter permease [Mycoplasma sp. 2045]|uniref:ABC transporter permease n=1 Tax=Mycoplasma sp. 2045 TaxID=2967301 RepID=UPI00211BCA3F|nr:ABC transporter permease [Mycoplasma sp. 2045]UUM20192.1 ABC transporter permease [Mycoplasma sp. 2045]
MTQIKNYIYFLHKVILKKKSSWIIPALVGTIMIVLSIIISIMNIQNKSLVIYCASFGLLFITIFFSSLKSINLYKDLEEEGLEIITFSKPISRKTIFISKLLMFLLMGLYWALFCSLFNLILGLTLRLDVSYFVAFVFITLITIFLAFIFFGSIASLISYKLNSKIAITVPLLFSIPMFLAGGFISSNSTSTANNFAYYLNSKNPNQPSGNDSNTNYFYLDNNKDNYYIIPNGYDATSFSQKQDAYLSEAYEISKNSSTSWSVYSYLAIPYQMLEIFNINNEDIFNKLNNQNTNNLSDYLYYKNTDSQVYSYILEKRPNLRKYQISEGKEQYIVPGALKNQSSITNIINTDIIYAREGASDFNIIYLEDKYNFVTSENLVGKLKWENIQQLLKSNVFNSFTNKYFAQLFNSEELQEYVKNNDLVSIKNFILSDIQRNLNDENSELNNLIDNNTNVLDENAIKNKLVKSKVEKQIYLYSALIYYIYFTYNDSIYLNALLVNDDYTDTYAPSQFKVRLDDYNYQIGGFETYVPKQQIINNQIVIRYDLTKSNNYLFATTDQIYSIQRNKKVVNKSIIVVIWIILGASLLAANTLLYIRKDYK